MTTKAEGAAGAQGGVGEGGREEGQHQDGGAVAAGSAAPPNPSPEVRSVFPIADRPIEGQLQVRTLIHIFRVLCFDSVVLIRSSIVKNIKFRHVC